MLYNENNLGKLIESINKQNDEFAKESRVKKYQLQVHSEGLIFDKLFKLYPSEKKENQLFVLNSYEPITKGGFWEGINNLKNVFGKTSLSISGDSDVKKILSETDFLKKCFKLFLEDGATRDPNAVAVWYKSDEWELKLIPSEDIVNFSKDHILFIDRSKSEYTEGDDISPIKYSNKDKERKGDTPIKIVKGKTYTYSKKSYVYISRYQYISLVRDEKEYDATIYDTGDITPYVFLGVDKDLNSYNSPLHPYFPMANNALVQFRIFNINHNIYGYPRYSEMQVDCEDCNGKGKKRCRDEDCDYKVCDPCKGTGRRSMQSQWNVWTVSQDDGEAKHDDIVKFYPFPTDNLIYSKDTYKETLKMAEKHIYVQNRVETGNVESAESKQETMKGMYSWLSRVLSQYYDKVQTLSDSFCTIHNYSKLHYEEPKSLQILDELEAFEILDKVIKSDAPSFLKVNQIEQYLSKYISQSNPLNRIISILSKYDEFTFFNRNELESYSDRGLINDEDFKKHIRAYPMLRKMIANDDLVLLRTDEEIIKLLDEGINRKTESKVNLVESGSE